MFISCLNIYKCVSRSFRTGRLERELQVVQLSATRCSCIAILWVNLVSFATITVCWFSVSVCCCCCCCWFRYRRRNGLAVLFYKWLPLT
jgi:hypothetical protein